MRILDFAMETQRSGRDFFRRVARRTDRKGMKKIFLRMAEDEERLLGSFRRLRTTARNGRADSSALQEVDNPFRRLNEETVLQLEDDLAAYRFLLNTEGEICRFYREAAQCDADADARALLRQVAEKECEKLERLEETYDFVNAPNEYLAWGEFSNLDEFHNFGRYEDNRRCRHTGLNRQQR